MQQIEKQYDEFVTEFGKNLGKVDVSLGLQIMSLQRKFPESSPKVELRVCYRPGTNLEKKQLDLDNYFACISTTYVKKQRGMPDCGDTLRVECLTDLDTVYKISQDPDVISIHGTASLGSY